MAVPACHVPDGCVSFPYMDGCVRGRSQVSCVPFVRLALVRSCCPLLSFGTGREGALLRRRGVLSLCRHMADARRLVGYHPMVRLDRRDALACLAQAVVLVDGVGGGVQSAGESLEIGVNSMDARFPTSTPDERRLTDDTFCWAAVGILPSGRRV